MATRNQNEKKFKQWQGLDNGGRRYWYDRLREDGYTIRYVKIVDAQERTLSLVQEVYNRSMTLVEIHEKFPIDRGHRKVA